MCVLTLGARLRTSCRNLNRFGAFDPHSSRRTVRRIFPAPWLSRWSLRATACETVSAGRTLGGLASPDPPSQVKPLRGAQPEPPSPPGNPAAPSSTSTAPKLFPPRSVTLNWQGQPAWHDQFLRRSSLRLVRCPQQVPPKLGCLLGRDGSLSHGT